MPHKDPQARKAWRQAYHKDHYEKNKEYYAEKRDRQKQRLRRMVAAYVRNQPCACCHEVRALEKRIVSGGDAVAHGVAWGWGPERLMTSLQRCVVSCAHCVPVAERLAYAA